MTPRRVVLRRQALLNVMLRQVARRSLAMLAKARRRMACRRLELRMHVLLVAELRRVALQLRKFCSS